MGKILVGWWEKVVQMSTTSTSVRKPGWSKVQNPLQSPYPADLNHFADQLPHSSVPHWLNSSKIPWTLHVRKDIEKLNCDQMRVTKVISNQKEKILRNSRKVMGTFIDEKIAGRHNNCLQICERQ